MASPKISVILPVYNPGEWLHECMRSVLDQSLRDIEVICIDDGSTDGSLDRLNEYATQDARVKVLSQPNSGAAVARNKGLSIAVGEFIAFMDPDDLYPDPEVLSTLYYKAVANGVDACGGCMMQFFPDGRKIEHYSGLNFGYEFTSEGIVEYSDYQFEYGYTRFIYRRKVIEDHGIRFPGLLRFQDPPFFVATMLAIKRFYALPIVTYCYRATDQGKKVDWIGNDCCRARHYLRGMKMLLELADKYDLDRLRVREMERLLGGGGRFLWQDHIAEHVQDVLDAMMGEYMPVVSVIVPVYNVERFVSDCLDSLLAQKYRNLEVICVNDGSTDDSLRIVESYRERFGKTCRLVVYSQKNGGLSAARNTGMDLATGKYAYFLDSDDMIAPETIGDLVVLCERENLDQVIFSSDVFKDGEGELIDRQVDRFRRYYTLPNEICGRTMSGDELFHALVNTDRFHASQPLRFYRLGPLKKHGCRFPVGMLHEDNYFAPLSLRFAERAMAFNRRYYQRRVRDESIMTATADLSPRLHGLFGVIVALCMNKELWTGSELFTATLRCFISTLSRGLGWHCRDTPVEKWGVAVRDIIQANAMGDERITTEFILPLLRDRIFEYVRANKAEKQVAALAQSAKEAVSLRQLVTAKDKRIDDLESRIKLRTREVVERNQLITAKDARIDDLERRIKLRTREVVECNQLIAAKDVRIDDLENRIKLRTREVVECNQLIAAKDGRIDGYIKQVTDLRRQMTDMWNSRAYRLGRLLTWPIRKLRHARRGH